VTKVTQAHIEARTQDILDGAVRLFARKGIEGTTMQEIASEAGISAGAIYRYYPGKEQLVRAVFDACNSATEQVFEEGSSGAETALEALRRTGRIAWDAMKDGDAAEQTVLSLETYLAGARRPEEYGRELRDLARRRVGLLEALVREARSNGEIDPSVDPRALALTLMAAYIGSRVLALELAEEADTDAIHRMTMSLLAEFTSARSRRTENEKER
jgi:AcrR family transcriptional regulator